MNSYSFPEDVGISPHTKDLITRILNLDPTKRPTLVQISEHPFYNTNPIPKLLPASTLACPSSKSYANNAETTEKLNLENTLPVHSNPFTTECKVITLPIDTVQEKPELISAYKSLTISKASTSIVWLKKWADYSSKYGLGYLLSNGSYGVAFNDATKMVLDPDNLYFTIYILAISITFTL
jgi:polo-like kinase 1